MFSKEKKNIYVFLSFLIIVGCAEKKLNIDDLKKNEEYRSNLGINNEIIMYMTDAEDTGQIRANKENAKYYRILISKNDDKFLVQDFYISGMKQTDPYWLIDGNKYYVFNDNQINNDFPREGGRIIWYKSGNKMALTNYKNHKEDGVWRTWYENGKLKEEMTYIDGKLDGIVKQWNGKGELLSECSYKLGKENGRCYEKYTINPEFYIYDGYYMNGIKVGLWREWDSNGNIIKEQRFN